MINPSNWYRRGAADLWVAKQQEGNSPSKSLDESLLSSGCAISDSILQRTTCISP